MIGTLRALFLGRQLREKVLLLALLLIGTLMWLSNFLGRANHYLASQRQATVTLHEQALWLGNRQMIANEAKAAASRLDPSQTLDGTRLLAEVSAMARDAGLRTFTSNEPQDVSSGQLAIHTLQFNITRADWDSLKTFYLALQRRSPYIGVEQFSAQADRANPQLLTVSIKISSVEIAHEP